IFSKLLDPSQRLKRKDNGSKIARVSARIATRNQLIENRESGQPAFGFRMKHGEINQKLVREPITCPEIPELNRGKLVSFFGKKVLGATKPVDLKLMKVWIKVRSCRRIGIQRRQRIGSRLNRCKKAVVSQRRAFLKLNEKLLGLVRFTLLF